MKDNQLRRIAVLLLDAYLHPCSLCAFPKARQELEPLLPAPGEWNGRRSGVKQKQRRIADSGEDERPFKGSFTRLVEIDCAENAREGFHALPLFTT